MNIFSILRVLLYFFAISIAHAEPENISALKNELRQYHKSGQYIKELSSTSAEAEKFLSSQIDNFKKNNTNKKLALILDIDETCLSNYDKLERRDFGNNSKKIHQEILTGNSPAILPMLKLYRNALKMGINVFFVTGRKPSEMAATQKNLINAGFNKWSGIYFRPNNYQASSASVFKSSARSKIEQNGYIILATIGDQKSDLQGGHAMRGFKLPNPFYYIP